jgi:hypothetical protein
MKRMFAIISLACIAALSFASALVDRAVDFTLNLLPDFISDKPLFVLDNGHPRSPLASKRAGLA